MHEFQQNSQIEQLIIIYQTSKGKEKC